MKRYLAAITAIALAAILAFAATGCGKEEQPQSSSGSSVTPIAHGYIAEVDPSDPYGSGIHHATVTVEGYGSFQITLDADQAPVTVANFCKLANDGFYNGLTFHRCIEGFCLQGGDPAGNGTGGSDEKILGEFSANGVANALADSYTTGTVAMARSQAMNSASSQWFVTLSDQYGSSLNGNYAAFGTVDAQGMAVVQAIVAGCAQYGDGNGTISDAAHQPVITSIVIDD